MQIVTLTTDLGLKDHFVAALKGQLLSKTTSIQIVDISHQVTPFSIVEASYYINNIISDFPDGTIHFIGVDSIPNISINNHHSNHYPIVMRLNNQFIVGNDNGVFSLLKNYKDATEIVRLDFSSKNAFSHPFKNIYVPAIQNILEGKVLSEIGDEITIEDLTVSITQQPVSIENKILGTIIHIDNYGNVIVNISENLFKSVGKNNPFVIYFRGKKHFIDRISENYNEVPTGEKLALFNENGWLEIAINKGTTETGGSASSLLGLKIKDAIRIEFHPKGSKDSINDLFS